MSDLTNFIELGLSEETIEAIREKGFTEPTPIQKACIPVLLKDNRDVIGQAQTGTGKTATFGLPILEIVEPEERSVQALIVTPTRELAVQVAEEIESLKGNRKIEVLPVYGGASYEVQIKKLRRGVQVVVGTPGRILDHLNRKTLVLDNLKFAVLDEADEMLDMGFIEDIENILSQAPEDKRMLCFSATMPEPIMKLAMRFMDDPEIVKVKAQNLTSNLTEQIYYELRETDKLEALCRIIDVTEDFYGLIFCRTKVQCDEIGRKLQERGYDAEALHGDLSQKQREQILSKMKAHLTSIVVATDVAARGIDISNLTHVINYSMPQDPESYIHRVGRTGRAGQMGTAITFITPSEHRKFAFIKRAAKTEIRKEKVPGAEQIIAVKKERIMNRLTSFIEAGEYDEKYVDLAQQLLFDNDPTEVLAAVLQSIYKDDLDSSKYKEISTEARPSKRNRSFEDKSGEPVRLFIARGRKDGLNKRDLVDYLIQSAGAEDRDIQDVSVMDDFSFVTAPEDVAEAIMDTINGNSTRSIVTRAKVGGPRRNDRHSNGGGSRRRGRSNDSNSSYQPYGRDTRDDEDEFYHDHRQNSSKSSRRRDERNDEEFFQDRKHAGGKKRPHGMYNKKSSKKKSVLEYPAKKRTRKK